MQTSNSSGSNLLCVSKTLVAWLCLGALGFAQSPLSATRQQASKTVTASASGDSFRFTSLGELIHMRLEVIASSGEVVFDSNFRSGNVIDWLLSDHQGQRLAEGSYLCVVSVKEATDRIARKQAIANIFAQGVSLQPADRARLSAAQAEAASALTDEDVRLTIVDSSASPATTVVAHDGDTAHLVSGRGGLTFSSGDFFARQLFEHMRLTPEGNLGVGVVNPQARLDVAGLLRTGEGIVFPDGTIQYSAASKTLGARSVRADQKSAGAQDLQPQGGGVGTQGRLAKWIDNAGTLGDSVIAELNGNLGIGTTSPLALLHLKTGDTFNKIILESGVSTGQIAEIAFLDRGLHKWELVKTADNHFGIYDAAAGYRVYVRNNGRVGIGTTNPAALLDVAGNVNTSTHYSIGGVQVLGASSLNTFVGKGAGPFTTGDNNSFFGYQAGLINNGGAGNSFFGANAGNSNTVGSQNAFFGVEAGQANTNASSNAFFGYHAGRLNTVGGNSFFGGFTGSKNTTGNLNSFFGNGAGVENTTGSGNTFVGINAGVGTGIGNRNGSFNTSIGYGAGEITAINGDNQSGAHHNTFIGSGARGEDGYNDNAPLHYATAIGAGAVVKRPNAIYLGRTQVDAVFVGGILHIGKYVPTFSGGADLCNDFPEESTSNGGYVSICSSSLRYKTNVQTYVGSLDIVRRLRPITFDWRAGGRHDLGFGAEEVEKVDPLLVHYNPKGEVEGVKYKQLTAVLVNAVNEQQRTIEQQQTLLKQQQSLVEGLKQLVCQSHANAEVCKK
jgi:hypothetical protein